MEKGSANAIQWRVSIPGLCKPPAFRTLKESYQRKNKRLGKYCSANANQPNMLGFASLAPSSVILQFTRQ